MRMKEEKRTTTERYVKRRTLTMTYKEITEEGEVYASQITLDMDMKPNLNKVLKLIERELNK